MTRLRIAAVFALIGIIFLTGRITSARASSCGGGTSSSLGTSCGKAAWGCGTTYCGIEAGEKRLAFAMLLTTDSAAAPLEARIMIESNEVMLRPDTVVTAYFQTHPAYRALLRPNDTWAGYSSASPVYVPHPASVTFFTQFMFLDESVLNGDTFQIVFGFVPHTYSDTNNLSDSLQSTFEMRETPGDNFMKIINNEFLRVENGRYVSPPPAVIATDPPCDTYGTLYYPKAGDLVITEIMKDPNGGVQDATGEWFEVLNASGVWLDMQHVNVRDNGSDFFTPSEKQRLSPMLLAPGKTFVYGKTADLRLNGGAKVDAGFSDLFTLSNTSDEIVLEVNGVGEIDRVEYTSSSPWPNLSGKSMMLADTTSDNNNGANWSASSLDYGNKGQKGTPNSPNAVQSDTPVYPPAADTPAAGDIVITEFLGNAINHDANGEWFEIFNASDSPLTLTNLTFEFVDSAGVTTSFQISTETILDSKRYMVFARDGSLYNRDLPYDYDYPDNLTISNDNGRLRVKNGGVTIDEIVYDGALFELFPDFGNGVSGGWPMVSEFDGRAASLQGSLAQLLDPNYDNNVSSNWGFSSNLERYGTGPALGGYGGFGTPGDPNVHDLSLTLSMPSSVNAAGATETFSVTITPGAGYAVGDIDTQTVRLFRLQRPIFIKVNTSNLRADFRSSEVPPTVERNMSVTADVTARLNSSDTPQRFMGTASLTVNDNRLPTPGSISSAASGDLVLSEVMVNGPGDENLTEYFELYNKSSKTIDLTALGIQDGGGTTGDASPEAKSRIYNPSGPFPLRIEPGQYKVIGRAANKMQIGGYARDGMYLNQDLNFSNSGDEVVVFRLGDNGVICQLEYSQSLNFPRQDVTAADDRSLSLVDIARDASLGANWTNAGIPYGDSGYGTPGAKNRLAAKSGDVLVSEVYANPPPGGEPNAEFFEAVNLDTVNAIDLSGIIVADDNGNTYAIDDYPGKIVGGAKQKVHVPAGGVFVFGNSRSASDGVDNTFDDTFGPGITSYDYPNSWTLLNTSPGDAVRLIRHFSGGDSAEIHGMTYSSSPEGKSWELDNLSDSLTYSQKTPSPTIKPAP